MSGTVEADNRIAPQRLQLGLIHLSKLIKHIVAHLEFKFRWKKCMEFPATGLKCIIMQQRVKLPGLKGKFKEKHKYKYKMGSEEMHRTSLKCIIMHHPKQQRLKLPDLKVVVTAFAKWRSSTTVCTACFSY